MEESFWWIVAIGFVAQIIDGALGMAYGLTATSFLLSLGYSPAMASATVHLAEVATTGFAGTAHYFARNISWTLVARLAAAGCVGGLAGAWLLSSGVGELLRPVVSLYLAAMGVLIVVRAFRAAMPPSPLRRILPLGMIGGFLDAVGGGGWGPIVSGTLVASGNSARQMIGSSIAAEFFVTALIAATFAGFLGLETFGLAALALALGGVPAAPLAALLLRIAPRKLLMVAVGFLVLALGMIGLGRAI